MSLDTRRTEHLAQGLLCAAGLIGLANVAPNLYWAFGGSVLLESMGVWLIDLRADSPILIGLGLLLISTVKLFVSAFPLLLLGPLRRSRPAWWVAVAASAGLIIYGAVGAAVNAGLLIFAAAEDPTGRMGQAAVWYPMLLVWGVVLAGGLRTLNRCDVMSS